MPPNVRISQEELDKFQVFLFEMDDVLEEFTEEAAQAGYKLDFSLDSLDTLERYYAFRHGHRDEERLINRCARYLGEVCRLTVGGKWKLSLNARGLYFKLPVITDYSDKNLEYCPLALFGTFTRHRNSGFLRKTVQGDLRYARGSNPQGMD